MIDETGFSLEEIAAYLELEPVDAPSVTISSLASLQDAGPGQLSFLFDPAYRKHLKDTRASAVIVGKQDARDCPVPALVADDPRLAFARLTALFDKTQVPPPGIEASASVSESASVGENVYLGHNVIVESGAAIGRGSIIGAGSVIGAGSRIGPNCRLWPNVTLYHDVHVGENSIIHSGVVIGADGFGFTFDRIKGAMVKIHQVYGVRIGNDVEIGAGTTIDRGALNHTTIGNGVKLDNQIQVGHGSVIGDNTAISGCTALAGSVRIGSYCLIGGGVGIINNVEVTDRVEITAMTLVSKSILTSGRYSSGTGLLPSSQWKRSIVGFRKLGEVLRKLKVLEARLDSQNQEDEN